MLMSVEDFGVICLEESNGTKVLSFSYQRTLKRREGGQSPKCLTISIERGTHRAMS